MGQKQKTEERRETEVLDKKQELGKVVNEKKTLEPEILKMTNESADLQHQVSVLKEVVQKEKMDDKVKISNLEKMLKEDKTRQDTLREETQSSLDKANKNLEDVLAQNSKYKEETETLRKENKKKKEKVKRFEQIEIADKELPMIRSIKVDSSNEEPSLGNGAYASVFKVVLDGRPMAIKKAEIGAESIKEALIMCKIRHTHVVSAIGVSIQNQDLLISMDCYDNDLSVHLENTEKANDLRHEWRIKVFKDCARGLEYLHKLKIIHRDLKPQNILLKHSPNSISASLADFGVSHLGLEGVGWTGTPGFIAPEMYSPDGTVPKYNELVDEWSLGACMYELIVCESLVQSEDVEEESNPRPKWNKVKVNIPAFLAASKGLLVMDPNERMSAKEVLEIL